MANVGPVNSEVVIPHTESLGLIILKSALTPGLSFAIIIIA